MSSVSHLINFDTVVSSTFTQTLDHFDSSNGKTFQQRYYHNNEWYKSGGPAFLMLGGEGPESSFWVSYRKLSPKVPMTLYTVLQLDWRSPTWPSSREPGSLTLSTDSTERPIRLGTIPYSVFNFQTPFSSDMSVQNLKYLSSAQAIEDAAAFIKAMTAMYPQLANAKWVTFGGSYSGALAAWTRAKHPELVYAAVGSSGPVQAEVDFTGKRGGTVSMKRCCCRVPRGRPELHHPQLFGLRRQCDRRIQLGRYAFAVG